MGRRSKQGCRIKHTGRWAHAMRPYRAGPSGVGKGFEKSVSFCLIVFHLARDSGTPWDSWAKK